MKAPHQTPASPAARLAREPYRFDFFQAVRLLVLRACRPAATAQPQREIGHDYQPDEELVRFRAHVSHAFPAGDIVDFRADPAAPAADVPRTPPRMTVAFLGLIGPLGTLPRHYTQLVIDRVRARDFALRDFLDLFHHRIVSLFYRAWAKYHFPVLYETTAVSTQRRESDIFTRGLYGLIGFGTGGLRDRLSVHDETLLYYAGLLAHFPRNAVSLERMLGELFRTPTEVLQFQGQWLQLDDADQSRLTTPHFGRGWNNVLGQTALVGECVWGVESKFRDPAGPAESGPVSEFFAAGHAIARAGAGGADLRRARSGFRRAARAASHRSSGVPLGRQHLGTAGLDHVGSQPGCAPRCRGCRVCSGRRSRVQLNDLARFWEGEAPAEPQGVPGNTARREPRPPNTVPRITQGCLDSAITRILSSPAKALALRASRRTLR